MKIKNLLFIGIINILATISPANGQAPVSPVSDNILTLTHVDAAGKALVEFPTGQRLIAKEGMSLPEGARVLVLERGTVRGLYHETNCEVEFHQNTASQVKHHDLCGAGTLSGTQKAVQMSCQISLVEPTITSSGFFSGFRPLYTLGVTVGFAGLVAALDDDDSTIPVSR